MRAYTLAILSKIAENNKPILDNEIIDWVNNKVRMALLDFCSADGYGGIIHW